MTVTVLVILWKNANVGLLVLEEYRRTDRCNGNIVPGKNQSIRQRCLIAMLGFMNIKTNTRGQFRRAHIIRFYGTKYEITCIDTFEGYKEDLMVYCKWN